MRMALTFALIALPSLAIANETTLITGEALQKTCTTRGAEAICAAYFIGVIHGIQMAKITRLADKPICLPEVSADGLRSEFLVFAMRHRDMLADNADFLVGAVLAAKFPCPKSN